MKWANTCIHIKNKTKPNESKKGCFTNLLFTFLLLKHRAALGGGGGGGGK